MNFKNIFLTLALFISQPLFSMERAPRPPRLTTVQQTQIGSFERLPADVKRKISRINTETGPILNIPARAEAILNLSHINRAFRSAVNQPENMLAIVQSMPTKAASQYFAEKLGKMPGIQSKLVQDWLGSIRLVNGEKLSNAVMRENSSPKTVALLLKNPDIDLNWKDEYGKTALMYAAHFGDTETVKLLLAAGANVNAKNSYDETALMRASIAGRTEVAKALIAAGANINLKDNKGKTALVHATENRQRETVKLLEDAEKKQKEKDSFSGKFWLKS